MQLSGQHAARVPRQRLLIVVTVVLGLALVAGGLVGLTPPTNAEPAVRNVRTGVWSDPSTWSGGKLPLAGEPAAIVAGTTVTVAGPVQAAGVTVEAGGRLAFDPNASAELTSTRNILVNGTLSMRPASSSVVQAIRFAGVDAARIVGGGMTRSTATWACG